MFQLFNDHLLPPEMHGKNFPGGRNAGKSILSLFTLWMKGLNFKSCFVFVNKQRYENRPKSIIVQQIRIISHPSFNVTVALTFHEIPLEQ
uniref:Uncharacterized protein n=1 Tax=Romanomermis culicivorax TaxID=13658 RepID=A0A915L069_ROMCU